MGSNEAQFRQWVLFFSGTLTGPTRWHEPPPEIDLYTDYALAAVNDDPDVRLLELGSSGMFSNVNTFLDHVIRAEEEGYVFAIDWSDSPYRDPSIDASDPWEYYFYPPFDVDRREATGSLPSIFATEHECVAPHTAIDVPVEVDDYVEDSYRTFLLLPPRNRNRGRTAIEAGLHLQEDVVQKIDDFSRHNFDGDVIGVHLRGPHRKDGGSGYYRQLHDTEKFVPFDLIFKFVDERLARSPDTSLFVASDSEFVIDKFRSKYGQGSDWGRNVLTYDAGRVDSGEMHQSVRNGLTRTLAEIRRNEYSLAEGVKRLFDLFRSKQFSSYELGVDVLIEAHLLSRTDHLIHGVSNITNFALCNDPSLTSDFIFKPELQNLCDSLQDWERGNDIIDDVHG